MRKYRSDGWWVAGWPSTGKIGEATECYHRHIFSHWFASIARIASIASLGIVQRSQMPTSDFSGKAGTPKVQKGRFRESLWSLRSSQALHRNTMQINDEQWWCNSILCTVVSEGGLFYDCWVRKKGKREKVFATFIVGPDEDEDHWIRIVSRIRINEQCHQSAVLLYFLNCGHIFFAAMYKKNFLIQMKFATMGKNAQI